MIGGSKELEDVDRAASSFPTYLGKIEATLLAGYLIKGTVSRYCACTKLWFLDRTRCGEIKRFEESKRTLNPFTSRLAEFDTRLKLLRITDQLYIVPVEFRFGRNRDFLALLLLPLAEEQKEGKRFDADWRLISSASFHTSSDNCERNTQKWNSNNRDCRKETIETWMWLRRSCGTKLREAECFATTH